MDKSIDPRDHQNVSHFHLNRDDYNRIASSNRSIDSNYDDTSNRHEMVMLAEAAQDDLNNRVHDHSLNSQLQNALRIQSVQYQHSNHNNTMDMEQYSHPIHLLNHQTSQSLQFMNHHMMDENNVTLSNNYLIANEHVPSPALQLLQQTHQNQFLHSQTLMAAAFRQESLEIINAHHQQMQQDIELLSYPHSHHSSLYGNGISPTTANASAGNLNLNQSLQQSETHNHPQFGDLGLYDENNPSSAIDRLLGSKSVISSARPALDQYRTEIAFRIERERNRLETEVKREQSRAERAKILDALQLQKDQVLLQFVQEHFEARTNLLMKAQFIAARIADLL